MCRDGSHVSLSLIFACEPRASAFIDFYLATSDSRVRATLLEEQTPRNFESRKEEEAEFEQVTLSGSEREREEWESINFM